MDQDVALLTPMFAMLSDDMNELGYVGFDIIFFWTVSHLGWIGFG